MIIGSTLYREHIVNSAKQELSIHPAEKSSQLGIALTIGSVLASAAQGPFEQQMFAIDPTLSPINLRFF